MTRRAFLRAGTGTAAGLALAACRRVSPTASPSRRADQVQLVLQDWGNEWYTPMVERMLERFHASHPAIRVFYSPDPDDVEDSLVRSMRAGAAPDVFTACCTYFPIVAQEGFALDLRPYVAADLTSGDLSDWDPAQLKALTSADGARFGLPKYHGALGVFYNKDMLDARSLEYPAGAWTYSDYLEAMRALTIGPDDDETGAGAVFGSMFDVSWERVQVHVNGWGGHLVDPANPGACAWDQTPAVEAMEWLRARMWDDRVMASFEDVASMPTRSAFSGQRVAMVEDGSWALRDILGQADFRVGVAPFPIGPDRHVTLATTDGYGIYAGTRHPEAAWELLKFLTSSEFGLALAQASLLQPARASLVPQWARIVRDEFPGRADDMAIETFADGHLKGYSVTVEVHTRMSEAKRLLYEAWDRVFTSGDRPVTYVAEACAKLQQG